MKKTVIFHSYVSSPQLIQQGEFISVHTAFLKRFISAFHCILAEGILMVFPMPHQGISSGLSIAA